MADSSPGSSNRSQTKPPLAPKPSLERFSSVTTDGSSGGGQPSSLSVSEDHFANDGPRPTISHPLDGSSPTCFVCQKGKC